MTARGLLLVVCAPLIAFLPAGAAPPEAAPSGAVLRLATGDYRPLAGEPAPPAWFHGVPRDTSAAGWRYLVAVTASSLEAEQRLQIEQTGAGIVGYLPVHGYMLRVAPESESRLRGLPFVVSLAPLPAWTKVDPRLAARAAQWDGASAAAMGGGAESSAPNASYPPAAVAIRILLFAGEPVGGVSAAVPDPEMQAAPAGKDGAWRVIARVPEDRLASVLSVVASLPEVEAVEVVRPVRAFNQDAVWVHQSFVGPSPQQTPVFDRGIFGCGQVVAIADTGQDYDSCYFRDTVNGAPPISSCLAAPCPLGSPALNRRKDIIYYNWSASTPTGDDDTCPATIGPSGHGTHTSGSIAGDTLTYANCATFASPGRTGGDGQAPGAKLVFQEMGDGFEYLNENGGTVWNLADVAYRSGARIHSNSWGGACFDILGECQPGCEFPYDSYARDADLAMWTYPDLLVVTAAGNGGAYCPAPISIGTPAIAKSPVAAGSVGHGSSAGVPSWFSSPGPVFDGRLKPDVAAEGESVVSAASDANPFSNNCSSCSLDGTSMSAPITAGLAALVREYYTAGYYATGARNSGSGFTPTGALLKATLLDGAVALSGAAPAPDFTSGYGRIQLNNTLSFTGSAFKLRVDDRREGVVTGGVVSHAYDVTAGTPFRATLVWSDYPAALNAATARVNELKLEVVDPSGTVWFQKLNPSTGTPVQTSTISDTHDTLNVAERIVFNSPAAGRWIVRVRGVDVPWGPQPFALVVRGALTDCVAPSAPGPLTLTTPATHQVLVSWAAVGGAAKYNVYRSFGSCPGGGWVQIASGATGTSFLDTTVSGGVTYSYVVTAASDAAAACESPRSPCASVVPTGDCTLPPQFHGVASAASAGQAGCGVLVSWTAGTPYCQGDIRYNVYRSTSPGFTPGPSNRIARCVVGTSWADTVGLVYGNTYYYAVRAEDASSGHGGACRGGNEEGNVVKVSAAPDGLPVLGNFSDNAGDTGLVKMIPASPWLVAATGGNTAPKVYNATSSAGVCADLTTPALTLADPGEGPALTFATKHNLDYDPEGILGAEGSIGQVEIATGPGFNNWTRVPLSPDYPAVVQFPYNNCPSTANITTYFSDIFMTYATYSASLSNWAGGDVKLRFHLSGDNIWSGGGWWVDDILITKAYVPGSCSTITAGPPPVPDGASAPGTPMLASRSGSNVAITWDVTQCPPVALNLYRGAIGNFTAFTAGSCALSPTGSTTLALPNNVWFLLAATNGSATDGSWARDTNGAELTYTGASTACPAISQHVTNNGCP